MATRMSSFPGTGLVAQIAVVGLVACVQYRPGWCSSLQKQWPWAGDPQVHGDNKHSLGTSTGIASKSKRRWAVEGKSSELRWWRNVCRLMGNLTPEASFPRSRFPPQVRRRFASRLAPQRPLQAFFRELLELHFPAEHDYRILDAGAGPFTQVGHVWAGHQVELFATDAMASEFDRLFAAHPHMRRPAVHTQQCDFERLSQCLRPLVGQLHFVWTQNSLDHAYDPLAGIAGMLYLLRPRGLLGVLIFENEAKNEGYRGMHQWNFWRSQPNRKPRLLLGDRWGIVADIEQSFAQNATLLRSEIVRYWSDDDSSGMEPISELQLHQVSKRHRWLLILLQKKESTAVRADSRPLG